MVVRTRARAILYPIAFYVVLGVASSYLVYGAWNGERGLKTKAEYSTQMQTLGAELQALQGEHRTWQRRVALMRSDAVDRDLLDEEARAVLDRVGKNDLVVFTAENAAAGDKQ
jgi:cell division protein FtsB